MNILLASSDTIYKISFEKFLMKGLWMKTVFKLKDT